MDRRDRITRILLRGSGLVLLLILVVIDIFWFAHTSIGTFATARYEFRRVPQVWLTPTPLPDISAAQSSQRSFSHFGYEFAVPWNDVDEGKITAEKPWIRIPFRSGMTMMFLDINPGEWRERLGTSEVLQKVVKERYGEKALASDFGYRRLILESTPRDITPWTAAQTNTAISAVLTMKAALRPGTSALYRVKLGDAEGFEIVEPWFIYVDLYRADQVVEFRFIETSMKPLKITQAEINSVLQSLRYVGSKSGSAGTPRPDTRS